MPSARSRNPPWPPAISPKWASLTLGHSPSPAYRLRLCMNRWGRSCLFSRGTCPFWQVLRFFNTAALVGNTAIIKHAETVQGSAEALETLVRDAGGPEGLYVNLAIRVEVVADVIADPRVRAATVTGSVRAGRAVRCGGSCSSRQESGAGAWRFRSFHRNG